MKRFYLLLFCILFVGLIAKPCWSEMRKGATTGVEWESFEELEKVTWIIGFYEGILGANWETYFLLSNIMWLSAEAAKKDKGLDKGLDEGLAEEATRQLHSQLQERVTIYAGTGDFYQTITGLDEFYKDRRNRKILVAEAVYIIKMKSIGAPEEFIEQLTRLVRLFWKSRIKEQKSLLKKNQEYRRAYEEWGKYLPFSVIPPPSK